MAAKTGKEKSPVLTAVPEWASTTAIAQLLGKSVRRVQQLTQDGILFTEQPPGGGARRYRTAETVQRYAAYLEEKAREEVSGDTLEELTLKKLQAEVELKESQGALHKLKTAIAEGKYIPTEEAGEELAGFLQQFKRFTDGIPTRVAGTAAGYLDMASARALKKDLQKELDGMLAAFVEAARIEDRGPDPP